MSEESDNFLSQIDVPDSEPKYFGNTNLTFDGLLDEPGVTIFEDAGKLGCGSIIWHVATILSRFVIDRKFSQTCKNVLELGSGTGLVGLALGLYEKQRREKAGEPPLTSDDLKIYITDQEVLLERMKKNIEINGLDGICIAEVLSWGEPLPSFADPEQLAKQTPPAPPVDLVLMADCVYMESTFPLLEKTLLDLTENDPDLKMYMSYQKRRKADARFFKHMKKSFTFEEITDYPGFDYNLRGTMHLYKITRKK